MKREYKVIVVVISVIIFASVGIRMFVVPEFGIDSVSLSSKEVALNENATISAVVKNDGMIGGTHEVILTVDDNHIDDKKVSLRGREKKEISFNISKKSEGEYNIKIGEKSRTLKVEGLQFRGMNPKVGDSWAYRWTFENGMVVNTNNKVEEIKEVNFRENTREAFVIESSSEIEDFGNLLSEEEVTLESSNVDVTRYLEKEGYSSKTKMVINLNFEYFGETFAYNMKSTSISELISGSAPEVLKEGKSWSYTEKRYDNETISSLGRTETSETESTNTANLECVGRKHISVEAGNFYAYKVEKKVVGEETSEVIYYSPETKRPVKTVIYRDGNIVEMEELIDYNFS